MSLDKIFNVYQKKGKQPHRLIGSYMQETPQHRPEILADYTGMLHGAHEGPAVLRSIKNSPYYKVVSRQDIHEGKHPELIPHVNDHVYDENKPAEFDRPSVFTYHSHLLPKPITLEFRNTVPYFDGHPAAPSTIQALRENVLNGIAQVRYHGAEEMIKSTKFFNELAKVEPTLSEALASFKQAAKDGHVSEDHLRRLQREIFVDPMVDGIGNKKAYEDFLSRPRAGVHIRLDGNDFGSINKIHGHHVGDKAIVAIGKALRDSMDTTVTKKNGKLFRIGGDEFAAHVPDMQSAAIFTRKLRSNLESIPPVGGTHNLSVSVGFGESPEHSDKAMLEAKKHKVSKKYPIGQAQTHVHSLISGSEGPVE